MPVVAIHLYHYAAGWDKRIDAELACQQVLRVVGDTKLVKESIGNPLGLGAVPLLLLHIHSQQQVMPGGIRITAGKRAIGDVVVPTPRSGRGPTKRLAARLANVFRLVPPLPLVRVVQAAEIAGKASTVGRYIDGGTTQRAGVCLPGLPLRARRGAIARQRAVLPIGWHPIRDGLAAGTSDGADLVFRSHTLSLPLKGPTVKPMGVIA